MVTEGVVEVRHTAASQDSTVLQPGDVAEVQESGATVVRRQQDVERLLAGRAASLYSMTRR